MIRNTQAFGHAPLLRATVWSARACGCRHLLTKNVFPSLRKTIHTFTPTGRPMFFLRFGPGSYILSHPDWMQRQVHTAHLGQQPIPHVFPFRLFPTLFTLPLRLEGLASVVQYLTIPQGGSTALLLNRLMVFFCNLL